MPSLRIAQIMASGPASGGLEKHFQDLCNTLAGNHQVLAIAHPYHARGLGPQVRFQPLDLTRNRRSPRNLLRLYHLLRDFQPEIVHAHANKAAQMVSSLRRFLPGRHVATVHGYKRNLKVYSRFDAVIAVSHAIRDQLALHQACTIPNGIQPPAAAASAADGYLQQALGIGGRAVALSAGRLAPVKGFQQLIEAWAGLDADLVIAGEGPERPRLEATIARWGLERRVHLVGFRPDVPRLMSSCDLVVIGSQREGFPYVMVEALHHRKVLVSTRFAGADAFLPAAYLVPYGDPAGLRRTVQQVLAEPEQAAADFHAAWDRAAEELTVQRMVERTSDVYLRLLPAAA